VQSATVDYLEVSHHDARGRRGDALMRTLQTERLEASKRVLDSRTCNLVLWVNYVAKRYWIDVGGFKIEDRCFGLELMGADGQTIPWDFASDCVKAACSVREGASVTDADFEAGIDSMMDCWNEYSKTWSDCLDLCP